MLDSLAAASPAQGRQVITVWAALRRARSVHAVLAALSMANTDTLRTIENEYGLWPAPFEQIRERIAAAHMTRTAGGVQMSDVNAVTNAAVLDWARDTLAEWLPGYTDYREQWGGQYRIRLLPTNADPDSDHVVIEIATCAGSEHRRHFRVTLTVDEVGSA